MSEKKTVSSQHNVRNLNGFAEMKKYSTVAIPKKNLRVLLEKSRITIVSFYSPD
jgi:hypothetical protein